MQPSWCYHRVTDLTDRVQYVLLAGAVHEQKLRVLVLFLLPMLLHGQFLLLLLLLQARGENKSKTKRREDSQLHSIFILEPYL